MKAAQVTVPPNGGTPTSSLWARAVSQLSEKDQRIFHVGTAAPSHILADIVATVEGQRDRCQRGRWKIRGMHGKDIIIRDVCAKIAACVRTFADVMDVAVSFDPVHAALPWAGVRFVLQVSPSLLPYLIPNVTE